MSHTVNGRRAAAVIAAALVVVVAARIGSSADFQPARAAEIPLPTASVTPSDETAPVAVVESAAREPEAAASMEPAASAAPELLAPAPAVAPSIVPAPVAVRVAAPATAQPTVAPAPTQATCAAGAWFCYPRVGISGAIVPYTDCGGSTDVGVQIRSFTCLSDHYLMAHAYTQFGRITGWQQGDVVFAYGHAYTIFGAIVAHACDAPPLPLAPLSMQTSLSTSACGPVLIVQAR